MISRNRAVALSASLTFSAGMLASLHLAGQISAEKGPAAPLVAPVGATAPATVHSVAASRYWWLQEGAACDPMAMRVLVGVETGNAVSVAGILKTAATVADFDQDGTDWSKTPAILAAYGVQSHLATASEATMDGLRSSLDVGHAAAVVVDPSVLWSFSGLAGTPGEQHVVIVAGIDDARHVVTVVDSAYVGGATETIPTAAFMTAWDATDHATLLVG